MDTTGYVSLAVSIGKAYGAVKMTEDRMLDLALDAHKTHCPFRRIDKCHNSEDYKLVGVCRGVEIDRWLWEHQDVTNYVILDDDSDMLLSQKKHFIKTHALRGISKRDVIKAIKILSS